MSFPSLRQFVIPRVPVVSDANVPPPDPAAPPSPDEVALRWGAPAYLNFDLELEDAGQPKPRKQFNVYHPADDFIIRHGPSQLKAINHDGETVAESLNTEQFGVQTLFYVDKFDEYTEETKQVGSVTIIKPKITHVELFVEWTDIFPFGLDVIYEEEDYRAI